MPGGGVDLGNAYVQIIPSAQGIAGSVSKVLDGESKDAGTKSGENIALSLVKALKGALVAAGVGKMIQEVMSEGGKLQQSYGGLDTIYGDAADAAKKYASEAVMAGISANDYAEQAVSFGASLKQAFEGDTTKAVEAANTAILDMTDNAAKMGTPLESIKNAYQGFAKGNYTMLDNLKLGYGGTKTEMERLLADATKLSGVKYDISNLGDVYEAIHVIQKDLNLTGVAAAEAEGTFSGSMAAMGAATKNFMANLALGEDIETPLRIMIESMKTFIVGNMFPMLANILKGVPTLLVVAIREGIPAIMSGVMEILTSLQTLLPQLQTSLGEAVTQLFTMLQGNFTTGGLQAAVETVNGVVSGIMSEIPGLLESGGQIVLSLYDGFQKELPNIATAAWDLINGFTESLLSALPDILNIGAEFVTNLANGTNQNLPAIKEAGREGLTNFVSTIIEHLPEVLDAGMNLLGAIASGVAQNLPVLLQEGVNTIAQLAATILEHLPEILQCGIELIAQLIAGIIQKAPEVLTEAGKLILDVADKFVKYDWAGLGLRIIEGIAQGLANAGGILMDAAKNAAKSAFDSACSFLGINSPSKLFRDEVGAMMAEGMAIGFEENVPTAEIQHALAPMGSVVPDAMGGSAYNYGGFSINIYQSPGQSSEELVDLIETRINQRIQSKQAVFA